MPLALPSAAVLVALSASGTVAFNVVNLVQLASTVQAAQVGGPLTGISTAGNGDTFDWGLPFFYGRRVFVVMEGATVNGKTGPLWAY